MQCWVNVTHLEWPAHLHITVITVPTCCPARHCGRGKIVYFYTTIPVKVDGLLGNIPNHVRPKGSACMPCTEPVRHRRAGVRRLFYGFDGSCERDEHSGQAKQLERKPNKTAGKSPSYRRRRTERTASGEPLTAAWGMRRATLRLFFGDRGSGRNVVPNSLS